MVYFCFSDENGNYLKERNDKFNTGNPFYIRASIVIKADEWKFLNHSAGQIKEQFGFPIEREIKWSYMWSIYKHEKSKKPIEEKRDYYFLHDSSSESIIDYFDSILGVLEGLSYCKIIFTVTKNDSSISYDEKRLYEFHIQDLLQRLQFEFSDENDLVVIFFDPVSQEKDNTFRDIYDSFFHRGDFYNKFTNIKDSLNIEKSNHSIGVQFADIIAGCFCGLLRDYDASKNLYFKRIWKYIRRSSYGHLGGYGIMEVPTDQNVRKIIMEKARKEN